MTRFCFGLTWGLLFAKPIQWIAKPTTSLLFTFNVQYEGQVTYFATRISLKVSKWRLYNSLVRNRFCDHVVSSRPNFEVS